MVPMAILIRFLVEMVPGTAPVAVIISGIVFLELEICLIVSF